MQDCRQGEPEGFRVLRTAEDMQQGGKAQADPYEVAARAAPRKCFDGCVHVLE